MGGAASAGGGELRARRPLWRGVCVSMHFRRQSTSDQASLSPRSGRPLHRTEGWRRSFLWLGIIDHTSDLPCQSALLICQHNPTLIPPHPTPCFLLPQLLMHACTCISRASISCNGTCAPTHFFLTTSREALFTSPLLPRSRKRRPTRKVNYWISDILVQSGFHFLEPETLGIEFNN